MNPRHALVAQRAGYRCEYCRAPEAAFNLSFEVEHIVPLSRGGVDDPSNWALSCRSCNLYKAAHMEAVDPQTLNRVKLFDPRGAVWQEHFFVQPSKPEIEGLTPEARATLALLRMNSPAQIEARRAWIQLGVFP